jgi:hypothetical protein
MSDQTMPPPIDDEAMENKLIALALRQAQTQLEEGTASSQVLTHFLRLASTRAQVELEKIELETRLLEEKILAEKSGQQMAELIEDVYAALRSYSYRPPGADDVDVYRIDD